MNKAKQLLEVLKKIGGGPGETFFPGIVKAVAGDTCTIQAADGTELYDVRLQAVTELANGLLLTPEVDSVVLLMQVGDQMDYAVVMTSKLQQYELKVGQLQLKHSADGWELKKGANSLGSVLRELITAIQQITCNVTQVGAPTGPPLNAAAFTTITNKLEGFIV